MLHMRLQCKARIVMCNATKEVPILHRKRRAAIARREAPERTDTNASARRAAMLHIIAFASRNSRKEVTMQCCKKRSEVADAGWHISTYGRRAVSKRRENAMLQ